MKLRQLSTYSKPIALCNIEKHCNSLQQHLYCKAHLHGEQASLKILLCLLYFLSKTLQDIRHKLSKGWKLFSRHLCCHRRLWNQHHWKGRLWLSFTYVCLCKPRQGFMYIRSPRKVRYSGSNSARRQSKVNYSCTAELDVLCGHTQNQISWRPRGLQQIWIHGWKALDEMYPLVWGKI